MTTDDWVTAALADEALVVELLFRLKQSSEAAKLQLVSPPPLRWGNRQPRSKPAAAAIATKKERESMRCSPTTPLSWSCAAAASPSDGCDESSGGRSKGTFTNDTTGTAPTNKRSRRKRTFAELKEQESLLLKERIHLKKELATLRITLEEQKARSENLKRLKLDLPLQSTNKMAAALDELKAANSHQPDLAEASTLDHVPVSSTTTKPNLAEASTLDHVPVLSTTTKADLAEASTLDRVPVSSTTTMHDDHPLPDSGKVDKEVETMERCFILPDLNMAPSEEDSGCDTLYGLS